MNVQPWVALALMFLLAPDPNPRKPAARAGAQNDASAGKSAREMFGLRGPVKRCTESTTFNDGKTFSTYTEFTPDGRMLASGSGNADGSGWVQTWTYDSDGRLLKTASGKPDTPAQSVRVYTYDGEGRLVSVANSDNKSRTEYQYDEQGRKTQIQTFDPKTLPQGKNVGFSGSPWDAVLAGFGVPAGGRVVTTYDENNRPIEEQVRDAEDHVVSRVVRTYNAAGPVVEEKPTMENPSAALDQVPADVVSQMNEAQKQTLALLAQGMTNRTTFYAYDAQGRVTIKRETGVIQSVTTTSYNEHGDMAEKHTTIFSVLASGPFGIAENGMVVPQKPANPAGNVITDSDTRFTYQYDEYGNWTEQSASNAKQPEAQAMVRRRTLTYY